jgi:D-amino-acid dehydrogenase
MLVTLNRTRVAGVAEGSTSMRVCVLGAGVIGLVSAYYLARDGHQVTIVDQNGAPGQECSYANGGQLSYSYVSPLAAPGVFGLLPRWLWRADSPLRLRPRWDLQQWKWTLRFLRACTRTRSLKSTAELLSLAHLSRSLLHELVGREGIAFDHSRTGKLILFRERAAFESAVRQSDYLARLGTRQEIVDADGCIRLEPSLAHMRRTIVGGVFTDSEEAGDCLKFCAELERVLRSKYKVDTLYHHKIEALQRDRGKVNAILTDRGAIDADCFVVAMGVRSGEVARGLGFELPLYALKGYSLTIPSAGDAAPKISITDSQSRIVYARLGQALRIAAMVDIGGRGRAVEPDRMTTLKDRVRESFPTIAGLDQARPWAGLRPATAQGKPIVSNTPFSNLFVNVGHGALGFTLACGAGRVVADLVSGQPSAIPREPYRLGIVH